MPAMEPRKAVPVRCMRFPGAAAEITGKDRGI